MLHMNVDHALYFQVALKHKMHIGTKKSLGAIFFLKILLCLEVRDLNTGWMMDTRRGDGGLEDDEK